MANAVRVRTASGWQDIALQGPAGLTQVWIGNDPPTPRGDYVLWVDLDDPDPTVEAFHYVGAAGEPAFQNSWQSYDGARPAGFYKDRGRVYLTGLLKGGATGTVAFTLPVGYRPFAGSNSYFVGIASPGNLAAVVRVVSDGTVIASNGTGTDVNAWVSLENISFRSA